MSMLQNGILSHMLSSYCSMTFFLTWLSFRPLNSITLIHLVFIGTEKFMLLTFRKLWHKLVKPGYINIKLTKASINWYDINAKESACAFVCALKVSFGLSELAKWWSTFKTTDQRLLENQMQIDALLKNFNTETKEKILDLRGSFVLMDCCALHNLCYMLNEGSKITLVFLFQELQSFA